MNVLLGLLSLAALSLFLASALRRSSSVTPIVAVAAAMLWFMLFGVLGLLPLGGWLWYLGCAAALGFVLIYHKKAVVRLFSPGFLFFVAAGVFSVILFSVTQPMFTQWDEFTFWGTAAKAVSQQGVLYTVADSNLIARSYPPGLIVFNYMMQFFGTFAEYKLMAAFSVVYLAAFAAGSAAFKEHRAAAVVFLGAMLLMPLLFEVGTGAGQMSYAYLSCMADAPMAAFFGGALCFYFAGGRRDTRLLAAFGVVLAALTSFKDMALALALIALFIAVVDMMACEKEKLMFLGRRRLRGGLLFALYGFLCVAASYGIWALHLALLPQGINRFDFGSGGQSLSPVTMVLEGLLNLVGARHDEQFAAILPMMGKALFTRPVSLLGPGIVMLALIAATLAAAWLLQTSVRGRRRVAAFAVASAVGFAAFYLFNVFTYAFIFKEPEAMILKDYERYIGPYWEGWLMASLTLLGLAAANSRMLLRRVQAARVVSLALSAALVASVLLLGNGRANVLWVSESLYGTRHSVRAVVDAARAEGMEAEDVVCLISQGDDATRFYQLGYEMEAERGFLFDGPALDESGNPLYDEAGRALYAGNASASLVPHGAHTGYDYPVPCTADELTAFLRQGGFTHLLVDVPDEYILETFAPLFADGLAGWTLDDTQQKGNRYYRIEWRGDTCTLVPERGAA